MTAQSRRTFVDDASPVRILHVDDDPGFLDLVSTYLSRIDDRFVIHSETQVAAAVDRLADGAVDCVVSDYDMPGIDGLTFLEQVRSIDPEMPFILYTGKGSEEIASEAISAGVTDYLQKQGGSNQYTVLANRIRNAVDQRRSSEALAASQQRLSRYIEQSPLGTIEYDETFTIARVNPAAEDILGYPKSELIGETWTTFVPEDVYRHVAELERDLLANKGGFRSVNDNIRRDGDRIRCRWHNQVVTDDNGEVISVVSQFEDVTDATERKQEIERMNAVLSVTLDTLPVGMLVEDSDRRVIRVNEQLYNIFGLPGDPVDAQGRNCKRFAVDISDQFADPPGFVERIERIVREGAPVDGEVLELADGGQLLRTYRPVDLPDGSGHLWAYRTHADREPN